MLGRGTGNPASSSLHNDNGQELHSVFPPKGQGMKKSYQQHLLLGDVTRRGGRTEPMRVTLAGDVCGQTTFLILTPATLGGQAGTSRLLCHTGYQRTGHLPAPSPPQPPRSSHLPRGPWQRQGWTPGHAGSHGRTGSEQPSAEGPQPRGAPCPERGDRQAAAPMRVEGAGAGRGRAGGGGW